MSGAEPGADMSARMLDQSALERLVLLRIYGAGLSGVARSELVRDVKACSCVKLCLNDWRHVIGQVVDTMVDHGLMVGAGRARVMASSAGAVFVADLVGGGQARTGGWPYLRDVILVGEALALSPSEAQKSAKALLTRDGLCIALLGKIYGLGLKPGDQVDEVRDVLAKHALCEAFGGDLGSEIGNAGRLPARMGRAIAARLAANPRVHRSDASLLAHLAGDILEVTRHDSNSLRQALTTRLLFPPAETAVGTGQGIPGTHNASAHFENSALHDATNLNSVSQQAFPTTQPKPDLQGFVQTVCGFAKEKAEGWAGNRRAYISDVWRAVTEAYPHWDLDQSSFKGMLMQAHQAGMLSLVNADLRNHKNIGDVEESAVQYKNMEWHFIRVVD